MTERRVPKIIIAGGGLAGCLAALAVKRKRPEMSLLLLEQGDTFGGNHIWSFFDTDIDESNHALVAPLVASEWSAYDVAFPARQRTIAMGYNSVRSETLDARIREQLKPSEFRLRASVTAVDDTGVTLADGERIAADIVIDGRGMADLSALDLAWQKFIGRVYQMETPHGLSRPIVMDATVTQIDGYRFVYCLPFSDTRLLVEDTYYSCGPELDRDATVDRIDDYLISKGWRAAFVESEEAGVLPITLGGDFQALWPSRDVPVARIGLRGGFFHPTTGYSFPDAVRIASLIAANLDLSGAALASLLRAEALRLWRTRGFYRLLNRMLFRAAQPHLRYRVLEHFYRLDGDVIARFYAGHSTMADKLRILSGRPPVSPWRALAAAR